MKVTLSEARADFSLHQRSQGLAHNTILNRNIVIRQLQEEVGDLMLFNIKDQHITQFFLAQSATRSQRSLVNTHSHLGVFFKWCVNTGRMKPQANPMNGRRRPKYTEKERARLHVSKFPYLLELADQRDPRDRAMVAVGLFALLRDQEMASIRIRDVDLDAGFIFANITKSHLEDRVPISAVLDAELRRWFVAYQASVGALRPEYLLIPSVLTERVQKATGGFAPSKRIGYDPFRPVLKCGQLATPLLEQAGIETRDKDGKSNREGAHTLRRSGARALYDALVDKGRPDSLRIVQTLLHHKNIVETQRYIGLNPDRETRDTIMRGAVLYGFENIKTIGSVSDEGEAYGDGSEVRRLHGG